MSSLFRASARSIARPATRAFSRHGSQNPLLNVILKNNAGYVTAIIASAVAIEFVYGHATYALWSTLNKGVRLVAQVGLVVAVLVGIPFALRSTMRCAMRRAALRARACCEAC
jgi:hypothetical protein